MSKGSKRNKDSDFEAGDNDSDDDFEKDFKNKKNKKTKADPGSEKKPLRDRRGNREDPFEREIKKAIEMSLKESSDIPNKPESEKKETKPEVNADDDEDFVKKPKKTEPKDSLDSNEGLDLKTEVEKIADKQTEVLQVEETKENEEVASSKKPKKTPPKPKKKSKKFDSDDDEDIEFEDEGSDDDFKKSKSKKKTPPKKKTTPNSGKKKKIEKKTSDDPKPPLSEHNSNSEPVKEPVKAVVSLKFDEGCDESKIIVPKLSTNSSSSSSTSRKSLSALETTKLEKKNLNSSLNLSLNSAPSPLGRIEIKSAQPQYRVGLSRNSKVKPLHPNVKLA